MIYRGALALDNDSRGIFPVLTSVEQTLYFSIQAFLLLRYSFSQP